jgi:hypothetical protein
MMEKTLGEAKSTCAKVCGLPCEKWEVVLALEINYA